MSVLVLSFIGGLVSLLSTSAGSLLAPLTQRVSTLRKYQMSMDFALGIMLSAVAFSLVGPELISGHHYRSVFAGLTLGALFIYGTHKLIERFHENSTSLMMIAALIFHNFPEGMGAGASLGGMTLTDALPIQVAISIQNVAEGLLLTLLLRGLGLTLSKAVIGGIVSGFVEMSGAVASGFLLQMTHDLLPFLLSLAGGAMVMSVGLELLEKKNVNPSDFLRGLAVIPLMNLILG